MKDDRQYSGYRPRIVSFDRVHCAIDFDMSNLSMVEVEGGYVAIDAGSHPTRVSPVVSEWGRISGGPPVGMIYTHSHIDHVGGGTAFALDDVQVWAQRDFFSEIELMQLLAVAYSRRGSRQFGMVLEEGEVDPYGIGRPLRASPGAHPRLIAPNNLLDERAEIEIGGTKFVLQRAPGETLDHLFVWIPERRVLFAGDNVYKAFPNLYPIRGSHPRPVRKWIDSLDAMRRLEPAPELLLLGHTEPVVGAETIQELLTDYRDAIAFVHDSVLRGINDGKTPDQLVQEIQLPDHLAGHPYLVESYGTIRASIRGIFCGYMGWLDGRGVNLDPVTDQEVAPWLIDELGGSKKMLKRIDDSLNNCDLRRAMWLVRILECQFPRDRKVRLMLAHVLEQAAEVTTHSLHRNWLKTEARELRNGIQLPKPKINGDSVVGCPVEQMLRLMPSRIDPEKTANMEASIEFEFSDTGRRFALLVRRGVGEVCPQWNDQAELKIECTEENFKRILFGREYLTRHSQFWKSLKFSVPEKGLSGQFHRLRRIVKLGRIFLQVGNRATPVASQDTHAPRSVVGDSHKQESLPVRDLDGTD